MLLPGAKLSVMLRAPNTGIGLGRAPPPALLAAEELGRGLVISALGALVLASVEL